LYGKLPGRLRVSKPIPERESDEAAAVRDEYAEGGLDDCTVTTRW
jgi:hypothetical protein